MFNFLKKILFYFFISFFSFILLFIIFILFQIYLIPSSYNQTNLKIENFESSNTYEISHPINLYVSESLEASSFVHNKILNAMDNSSTFFKSSAKEKFNIAYESFFSKNDFEDALFDHQYTEQTLITLTKLDIPDELHNYEYNGVLESGKKVTGNINIGDHTLAVSFLNSDYTINDDLANLLTDDSNSEMLAYLIVKNTQEIFGTSLEPNIASKEFYNCTVEQLAGSISYHALMSSLLYDKLTNGAAIDDELLTRTSVANISKENDSDAIIVNRSY